MICTSRKAGLFLYCFGYSDYTVYFKTIQNYPIKKDPDQVDEPGKLVLPFYRSPPYLNSIPQIRYHRLGPRDRALVIARSVLIKKISKKKIFV